MIGGLETRQLASIATMQTDNPCTSSMRAFGAPWLVLALLAAGCSHGVDVPLADNYAPTLQKKARAVHHWDVLADDVAGRIAEKLRDWPSGAHPIYIVPPSDARFEQGFRRLLTARLLDRGVALSVHPTPVQLSLEAMLVQHESAGVNRAALPFTRLALGLSVARDWYLYAQGTASAVGAGVVTGALLDITQASLDGPASGGPTRTEVLITTTLQTEGRLLASTADVYYIEREDAVLYQPSPPPPPPPPPTPYKVWRVTAP